MGLNDAEIVKLAGPNVRLEKTIQSELVLEYLNAKSLRQLLVTILNWGLFGVLNVQACLYCQAFSKDRPILRAAVHGVYLLETIQTMLITVMAWKTYAKDFGQISTLYEVGTLWASMCLIGGATAMVAQTFYAYRIMIISQKKIIPTFIVLMSFISFMGAVAVAVIIKQAATFNSIQAHTLRTSIFLGIWAGIGCACDIVIAVCMCFYLSRRIREGCFPKTQALIFKVMRMTIESGALTASVSVVTLAMYYARGFGGFLYYGVPLSVLAKLYSNTMLVLLNSRIKLGIVAESTTWQENELHRTPFSHTTRQNDGIEIRFASNHTSENSSAVGTMEVAITVRRAKQTAFPSHTV